MQRWIWPLIVTATLLTAIAADHLMPGRTTPSSGCTRFRSSWHRPTGVLEGSSPSLLSALSLALDDLYVSGGATTQGVLGFALLGAVGILALINTLHREEMCRRLRRQQAAIDTVQQLRQPLTVILGNIQLLEIAPPSETTLRESARRDAPSRCRPTEPTN